MNFNEYQERAMSLRLPTASPEYVILNFVGEVGEFFGKLAKAERDGVADVEAFNEARKKELGDILWQFTGVVVDQGFELDEIAESNLEKLESRRDRGKLQGSGDDR